MTFRQVWCLSVLVLALSSSPQCVWGFAGLARVRGNSALCAEKKKKVFIDGEAGTTGLQVRERLAGRTDLEMVTLGEGERKDRAARKAAINAADCVILCLPDEASIEAVDELLDASNKRTVIIDASTAYRVHEDWTYGFAELNAAQKTALRTSTRISNPGCYPTGFVALTRPLVDAGLLSPDTLLTVNAVSGYSGGGKQLMELYEDPANPVEPWGAYAFNLAHKHLPEMQKYSTLHNKPVFQPQVAAFAQGMVVSVPLHYAWLNNQDKNEGTGAALHAALAARYADATFVEVLPMGDASNDLLERGAFLRPDTLADSNRMQLFVFPNDEAGTALLCARLDNLGKGASGAAVQNMNLALGLEETQGLL